MSFTGVKRLFFSRLILDSSKTKRIALVGVLTAFSVVTNMFLEFKMYDVQFSFTILVSTAIGILLGSLFGFFSCMLGDFIGYIVNSWGQLYMPWVGLSTGMLAFIAGVVVNGFEFRFKGQIYLKLAIVFLASFLICTVGINSTGFYFYNKGMGFSSAVLDYVSSRFGGDGVSYFAYLAYRLIFKGQIFNNLFNYALGMIFIPVVLKLPMLKNE